MPRFRSFVTTASSGTSPFAAASAAPVPSVLPSSHTMISKSRATRDATSRCPRMTPPTVAASLNAGMTIESSGIVTEPPGLRESPPEDDQRDDGEGSEQEERRLDGGGLVSRGDEVRARGHLEPDEAGRHHERPGRLIVDGDAPVRVVGDLEHDRRGTVAGDQRVHAVAQRSLVRDAAVRAPGRSRTAD